MYLNDFKKNNLRIFYSYLNIIYSQIVFFTNLVYSVQKLFFSSMITRKFFFQLTTLYVSRYLLTQTQHVLSKLS